MGQSWPVTIRWTGPALADLDGIVEYVAEHSPQGARRVTQRIRSLVEQLSDHPLLGKQTVEPSIRRLTTAPYPYLIFYEVTGSDIIVHAVRHGRRDLPAPPLSTRP